MPRPFLTPPHQKYPVQSYTTVSPVILPFESEDEEVLPSFLSFRIPASNIGPQSF